MLNPFTAVPAAPSLEKRPNLKSLRLSPLFARAREGTSTEMHSTESRVVIGPSNMLFAACMCALFSPENLRAGTVKGLTLVFESKYSCSTPPTLLHWHEVFIERF